MAEVKRLPDDGGAWFHFRVGQNGAEVYTTTKDMPNGKVKTVTWLDMTVHDHPAFIVAKGIIDINELDPVYMTHILGTISNTPEELAVDAIVCYPVDEIGLEAEVYDNRADSRAVFINTMHDIY
ncbi:hypothetical protein Bp8pC_180 [Bacillus phage Bp8p-C]|uniref:Uncharacterized protein n=2 Tax=Agatevirus Bp8pC TaxID=1910937 RepID=A0A0A0PLL3_9CAUD|nr:hypothetical protein AXJ20_gp168 [Bacillus phage Bp8p-C]YP_009784480.1 hypothetical protein QLX39_gp168 [Bacillus phage Bp8p-T]AHJ87610.1 hypothetical protein Bp8pC_180 [Bacillus phage Bp8p-C]AHJ87821.1 hypothetical protein Bp8pT_180 [Bacillus phage Bp8p-T]